ncbi:efflux RND transporter permease subunit [Aestuariirhabdus sp. Z084]|uniref:efflux RND transporter permease subunit n=1 Tax=Aestuariirhabdus haliotis TaxID=2918751 RepID=UPI00201B43F7|nr:efflux RND transporter permease subunit [Aestuariirhabdus haliotis]MCL6416727.1 efflux RND transporter permease subunit [Aestuariirhabdus haliotis]MCL6420727.1 efflux RND transporter permease subunit [Aestuariirhabdus haliotis]
MDKLTRFVIDHARFSGLMVVALFLGGLVTFASQPRQEDPEITTRSAQVVTSFPGLSPERIEQLITRPIEDKIKEIPEIKEIKSVSMAGMSIITPEVHDRYYDMNPIWADLRNKMDDLRDSLPEGTQGPKVNDDYGRVAVVTLALTGADYSMAELYEVAKDTKDNLGNLPLVASVDLYGVQEERIWLEFDSNFMSQFNLTPATIVNALRAQNIVLPGGTINAAGQNVVIEPSGDLRSVEEIQDLAIETDDGELVYLRDLATVRRDYIDPPKAPAFFNNQQAIVLGISMVSSSNVVELGKQINERLALLTPKLPLGMHLDIAIFQPDLVQASVSNATNNLMQTMVAVLVVVMLFLGWRTGLIVGAMVPLSIMATLIGMAVWGIELHRISIAAIIVALGLLVDNGVVIAEDIRQRMDRGMARLDAVTATPKALAIPLLTSSLTTILAFMPLILIDDSTGEFLRSLGQVLALALLASWTLSITLTPAFCYWFLPDPTATAVNGDGQNPTTDNYHSLAYRFYRRLLNWLLKWRVTFIVIMVALLFAAGEVFQFVKQRSLGPSERNQFTIYLDLPAEAHISETLMASEKLSTYLTDKDANPEVTDILSYVGSGGPRFFLALSPNDAQPNKAFFVVNTQTSDQIDRVMERVEVFLKRDLPQANGRTDILFLGSAALGTVEIRAMGPDGDVLRRIGEELKASFYSVPGSVAIRSDWENPVLKLRVDIDQERARRAGVTSEAIAQSLYASFDGQQVTSYRENDKVIPVTLRAQSEDRGNLDRLRTVEVLSTSGVPVPLLQIANFEGIVESSRIRRYNQQRALTIAGKHPQLTAQELYAGMQERLDEIELPRGYTLELEGELKSSQESNENLFGLAPHALFLILMLLVLQFNSFRRPAIILLTIPLVIIGANFGLALFGAYFDFTSMLGLFSLAGIIINNGIVMIDRIDQARNEGLSVDAAVMQAALSRARPIIMTTITTIVGLLPLALFGGEFWHGMAIVIMCGLGVGTLLTLGFVPVLYSLFFRSRREAPVSAK